MTLEALQKQLATLKTQKKWTFKPSKTGKCEHHAHYDEKEVKVMHVTGMHNRADMDFCKDHFTETVNEFDKERQKRVKHLEEEIDFQSKLAKITRFAQVADLAKAVRVIIRGHPGDRWNHDKSRGFDEDDIAKGKQLLRMLRKIEPKHSQFLERGVAVNKNLFLAGTASADEYDSRPTNSIVLTAIDEARDDFGSGAKVRVVARMSLTLGEAERFKGLFIECVEHVRIKGMIELVKNAMKLSEPEDDSKDWMED
jgi:hypothetical protein